MLRFLQFMCDALDGDIKHAAIVAMGMVMVAAGTADAGCQERLASQLNNEVTRSGAAIVISLLAKANIDISSLLGSSLSKVVDLTRQADQFIRQQALTCLKDVGASTNHLSDKQVVLVMQGLSDKVLAKELRDAELALQATSALVCNLGAACASQSQAVQKLSACS